MPSSIMISNQSLCGAGSWSGTGQLLQVFLSSEAYPIRDPLRLGVGLEVGCSTSLSVGPTWTMNVWMQLVDDSAMRLRH
jgi:hypothetical protein